MKKYKLTNNKKEWFGKTLYQIESLIDFGDVKKGDKGGYIEKEENLSHEGNAWVYGDAKVCDNAKICDNAKVYDNAWVYGNACMSEDSHVYDSSMVFDNARMFKNATARGKSTLCNNATVCGGAKITNAFVGGDAEICRAWVDSRAFIAGDAKITRNADLFYINTIALYPFAIAAYKNKNGGITVSSTNIGVLLFDDFIETINEWCTNSKASKRDKVYKEIIELIKIYFNGEGWSK